MEILLGRPGSGTRVFPLISVDLYGPTPTADVDSPGGDLAQDALRLASAPLTGWQRLAGGSLDPLGKVKRLLHFHRLAFHAETAGEYVRSDFFWSRFHELCPSVLRDLACAQALTTAIPAEIGTPELLQSRLVDEVFIDAHLAFFNGSLSSAPPAVDRAFRNALYIERLLPWSGLDPTNRTALQQEIARRLIEARGAVGSWDEAAAECSRAIEREPRSSEFQDRFVMCVLAGTLSRLGQANSAADAGKEAALLKKEIDKLESFQQQHPDNPAVCDALGRLWAARAVRLARLRRLPEGLVNMERARAWDPWLEGGEELQDKLFAAMEQLQQQMRTLDAELRQRPGTTLSVEGLQLQREAKEGFRPLEAFRASGQAEGIEEGRARAVSLRFWRNLGLPELAAGREQDSLLLLAAINDVLREPPENAGELPRRWAEAVKEEPGLSGLDLDPVLRFLGSRLFGIAEEEATAPDQPSAAIVAGAPRLVLAPTRGRRSVPLAYWVFSGRDLRIKLQAVAAILLLGSVGVLAGREEIRGGRRDAAYAQLLAARDRNDDSRIMEAAETFLANPLLAKDGREETVENLYSEAVVRNVLSGAPLDGGLQPHLDRYRELVTPEVEAEP